MPLKKDGSGKRWIEMEFITPGTPEQVWQAMATGPGNAAWFTTATIEERVGGALRFDFGEAVSSSGEVTTWEPPLRFGYVERDWSPGAPPVATEITIASRKGGECVVRMVHSLFASTDGARPEPLSGVVERLQQDRTLRYVLMRLERPSPGVALIGTHDATKNIYVSVSLFFYGDNAAAVAAASEQKWRHWMGETFATSPQ